MTITAKCDWADIETPIWNEPDTSIYSGATGYGGEKLDTSVHGGEKPDQKPKTEAPAAAKKFDNGKPDVSLVAPELILGVAQVMTFGAAKYGRKNYMESAGDPVYVERLYAAIQRHLLAYASGERIDPESGQPHLYHVAAGIAMLTDLDEVA